MRKRAVPFYPLLIPFFPILSVYATNLTYVPVVDVLRPLALSLLGTALVYAILFLLLRKVERAAAATAVFAIAFFGFTWTDETLSLGWTALPSWAFGTLVLMTAAARWITNPKVPNVIATFMALLVGANIALDLERIKRSDAALPSTQVQLGQGSTARPDIFYIILDGHGREDSLRRAIGYDDSAFIEGLRKRGFYVADRSRSNYVQTELSIPSSLNLDAIPTLLPNVTRESADRSVLDDLIDHNELARRLKAKGYRTFAVTTGFPPVRFQGADVQVSSQRGQTMLESTLIGMTPFSQSPMGIISFEANRRQTLLAAFDDLQSLAPPTLTPKFVFAHILAPHPPFVFGPNGEPNHRGNQSGYYDGNDYLARKGTPSLYREGYAGQAAFIEKKTLQAIDRLLAAAGPIPPVIVVQGDHGSKVGLDQNSLARTDLHECFPILNAYLVPPQVQKALRPDITPVNSFRVILHGLFGDDLPLREDRSWYSPFGKPFEFTDVTDRIEIKARP